MLSQELGPVLEIQTGPTDYCSILEIEFQMQQNNQAGAQISFGVGKPQAQGVGYSISRNALIGENALLTNTSPGVQVFTDWSKQPTVPLNYFRRWTSSGAATTGQRTIPIRLRFPAGLKMAASSSIVVWSISTGYATLAGPGLFDVRVGFDA